MKVKDLGALLSIFKDQNAEVRTEGCDCYGDVGGVAEYDGKAMIYRPDGAFSGPRVLLQKKEVK